MSIASMLEAIAATHNKETGVGASSEEIDSAERILGVALPEDYEYFLRTFGWARLEHDELYGVGHSVPAHLQLVRNTQSERTTFRPFLPMWLVPVMPDGAGNHYCIDTSKLLGESNPIVFWDHDAGENQFPTKIANSFSDWIVDHLKV